MRVGSLAGAMLAVGLAGTLVASAGRDRCRTLEDLYGDTGNRFQGAIGFQNRESRGNDEAASGFGISVDDVVLQWREFTLEPDATDCALSGACATINLESNNVFEGDTRLTVTVEDRTPSPFNDCDFDGVFDGTRDCDGDGIDDVVVQVNSFAETAGEIVVLNRLTHAAYRGTVPISASYDMPGVLFVAAQGSQLPTVTATYLDLDDGTGQPCQNSPDPAAWGRVQTTSTVFITSAEIQITRFSIDDNGDRDAWADDFETVLLRVEASNKTGVPLTGLTLRATSNDPSIDCLTVPFIEFGDLAVGESRFSEGAFEFTMGQVDRQSVNQDLSASINIIMDADQFQSSARPQSVTFDLDLDASGGGAPTTYFDGFESGLVGWEPMHLDADLNPPDDDLGNNQAGLINADGSRCQYSDPDWERSASYGSSQAPVCFPNPNDTPDNFWFTTSTNRAFNGATSLYWGVELDPSLGFTAPTAQLEALRTKDPINLGWDRVCAVDRSVSCDSADDCPLVGEAQQDCVGAQPTLSFKHQASQLDHRTITLRDRSPERGIVMAQLAANNGAPMGHWIKLVPYVNTYDSQAVSNFFNCTFDPMDDGNTEQDFFDPTSPTRYYGPSSTCAPEFSFAEIGETGQPFSVANIGAASDGPGLEGSIGLGTWIESTIDLSRFRGRRLYLRFLMTGLKLGSVLHWEAIFVFNPDPRDDGWWIDDVRVTDALLTPAEISVDLKDNTALPGCGTGCESVVATVSVEPAVSRAPGQSVVLDASASEVPRCLDGVAQYLFAVDVDLDGRFNRAFDALLRDWSGNDRLLAAPQGTTNYLVGVRCGTETTCNDVITVGVDVQCPASPSGLGLGSTSTTPFLSRAPQDQRSIRFVDKETLVWAQGATLDVARGDLTVLRASGGFVDNAILECVINDQTDARSAAAAAPTPPPGGGWFFSLGARATATSPLEVRGDSLVKAHPAIPASTPTPTAVRCSSVSMAGVAAQRI